MAKMNDRISWFSLHSFRVWRAFRLSQSSYKGLPGQTNRARGTGVALGPKSRAPSDIRGRCGPWVLDIDTKIWFKVSLVGNLVI